MFYKTTNVSHSQYTYEAMNDCTYTLDIIRAENVARVFLSTTDNGFALVAGKFDLTLTDDEILSFITSLDVDELANLYEELSASIAGIILEDYESEDETDYRETKPGGFIS